MSLTVQFSSHKQLRLYHKMACLEHFVEQQRPLCRDRLYVNPRASGSNLLERIKVDVIDCEHIQEFALSMDIMHPADIQRPAIKP